MSITIVILTFNRPELLEKSLTQLHEIKNHSVEVIVVDNHSDMNLEEVTNAFTFAKLIRMDKNYGVSARNAGIAEANHEIVVCLDDDVFGITDNDIDTIYEVFKNNSIAAICFGILDEKTEKTTNWIHHRKQEDYYDKTFITDEISEGAVALRRNVAIRAGLYPEEYFISHEGPDLAIRMMNLGYSIIYSPAIKVRHAHSPVARLNWRRYYYDTRNLIWLVLRNYPLIEGVKFLVPRLLAMAVYSVRDGYFRYWVTAVKDAVLNGRHILAKRQKMSSHTIAVLNDLKKFRPGYIYLLRKRMLKKKIRI